VAQVAVAAAVQVIVDAGHLTTHPAPLPAPELTVEDAAKLLCELSGTPRLDEPDKDWVQLRDSEAMVDYAYTEATRRGLSAGDVAKAIAARDVLRRYHRNR
jgi:hypothetical protein